MKRLLLFAFLTLSLLLYGCNMQKNTHETDLSGEWEFRIDSADTGVKEKWFTAGFHETVRLPGSMQENGKGYDVRPDTIWTGNFWNNTWFTDSSYAKYRNEQDVKISFWLQPKKRFAGVAWYRKKINIPASRQNETTQLILERCHWETTLWIDTICVGMQNALGTPHIYTLPGHLTPGEHTLTLRVDNRIKEINPGVDAHSISDNTQTNWNGITGEIKLINRPRIHIRDIQIYPDITCKKIDVFVSINHYPADYNNYEIELSARSKDGLQQLPPIKTKLKNAVDGTIRIAYPMGDSPLLWDEFTPNLYTLTVRLSGKDGSDIQETGFGMRSLSTADRHIRINGRKIFLRGTLECCIFPKTGFPPTQTAEWTRIFDKCKAYGLNHVRFHSWCPPEAAFQAADSIGMYLAVECGAWTEIGSGQPIDRFVYEEAGRILQTYGNHPSFCTLAYGNEPAGPNHEQFLGQFVAYCKNKDNRRLYTTAFGWANVPENDFHSSADPRIQHWEEGLKSIINAQPPRTDYDWNNIVVKYPQPTISHEIGQWCVYPNFKEMNKYTGILQPKNFEIFRDRLKENNLDHLADSFLLASGKLQVLCYKADIEAAFRTSRMGGFQLLDIHDFPGQGTALVGVLDAFWDDKGYITASGYKQFCDTTVLLARMPKLVYLNNETLGADIEIAHFGKDELNAITPEWKLTTSEGTTFASGKLSGRDRIPFGNTPLGRIQLPLNQSGKAGMLTLAIQAGNIQNQWNIWVYPNQLPEIKEEKNLRIVQTLDPSTEKFLNEGGTVLLTLKKGTLKPEAGGDIAIGFSSIFWNTSWTNKQAPHTLGILCNPKHPVFNDFPTEYHSNYQWWDAMTHSNAIRSDAVSAQLQPIVRVIDDWFTARPLALLFECKTGKGKLFISGIDLINDLPKRPEARQLLYSIKQYMLSDAFNPQTEVHSETIKSLLK